MLNLPAPTNYLKGNDFNNMLLKVTKCENNSELSVLFDVPRSTFYTWSTYDRTGYEIIIRLHKAMGISIQALALGQFTDNDNKIIEGFTPCNGKILPYKYLKGTEFTSYLKSETQANDFMELSEIFNIPKSTFSTWNLHNRCSYEVMVRMLLAGKGDLDKFIIPDTNSHSPVESNVKLSASILSVLSDLRSEQESQTPPLPVENKSQDSEGPYCDYFVDSELETILYIANMPDKNISKQLLSTLLVTLIERNQR